MPRRTPTGPPPPPVVQRLRVHYAKRGRLRFSSHRDFARAFERALRRAEIPMAYSAGFTPHPKISYLGAAPTGVASEAEYLEIGLARETDPETVRAALDEALPDGLDVVEVVPAGPGSLAERMQAVQWHMELPGVDPDALEDAVLGLLGRTELTVERVTKDGRRSVDVRAALVSARVRPEVITGGRAILDLVVRQATPAVRPDDILSALRIVAGLAPDAPAVSVRVAQGPLDEKGTVSDPLAPDRAPGGAPSQHQNPDPGSAS